MKNVSCFALLFSIPYCVPQQADPQCSPLNQPINGDIEYSQDPVGGFYANGTIAVYSCSEGLLQSNGANLTLRICTSDRSWSGTGVTCLFPGIYTAGIHVHIYNCTPIGFC